MSNGLGPDQGQRVVGSKLFAKVFNRPQKSPLARKELKSSYTSMLRFQLSTVCFKLNCIFIMNLNSFDYQHFIMHKLTACM